MPSTCDSSIPLVAQELMRKMIHQFAIEYASKSQLHTARNGLTSGSSSPLSDAADPDAPLDLTMSRNQENHEKIPQQGRELNSRLFLWVVGVDVYGIIMKCIDTMWYLTLGSITS